MSNPIMVDCPADTWTLVAKAAKTGFLHRLSDKPNLYLQAWVPTGNAAPTAKTDGVPVFVAGQSEEIVSVYDIDVYIFAVNIAGRVRSDVPNGVGGFYDPVLFLEPLAYYTLDDFGKYPTCQIVDESANDIDVYKFDDSDKTEIFKTDGTYYDGSLYPNQAFDLSILKNRAGDIYHASSPAAANRPALYWDKIEGVYQHPDIVFDGTNSFLSLGDFLSGVVDNFTVLFRAKVPDSTTGNTVFARAFVSDRHFAFYFIGELFVVNFGANYQNIAATDNEWHVCGVSVNSGNIGIYMDSNKKTVGGISVSDPGTIPQTTIGSLYGNASVLDGFLSHLAVFDRVLSDSEISTIRATWSA